MLSLVVLVVNGIFSLSDVLSCHCQVAQSRIAWLVAIQFRFQFWDLIRVSHANVMRIQIEVNLRRKLGLCIARRHPGPMESTATDSTSIISKEDQEDQEGC